MLPHHSLLSMLEMGPIDACVQMSNELPRMTVQELHAELPFVIRRIFSFSRFDWSLRDICNERSQLYSIIHSFLSPWHGELWRSIVRLQEHSSTLTFQFNINDLPSHLRARASSVYSADFVQGRPTNNSNQTMNSLSLEPIEYFLFNLLSYGISDQNAERPMRSDSVYLRILEMYLCLFLPIDAEEFRFLLMTSSVGSSGVSVQATSPMGDPRRIVGALLESPPKKTPIRQSFLFGGNSKQRENDPNQSAMNLPNPTGSSIQSPSSSVNLSANSSDANELLKRIDYFIKCYTTFLIDVFQPTKSVYGAVAGGILIQEFNFSEAHLLCIRMFIKRLHLFCSFQIGSSSSNSNLTATTGLTTIEQRTLLLPLQNLKKNCVDFYVRSPLQTFLQNGMIRCPLDQRYNTLLFIWYTYIRPWRYSRNSPTLEASGNNLLDPTNTEHDEISQDQSINNTENSNFVERNLFFYGRIFQSAINRLQKTDLTNPLIGQMISKLSKVFSAKNFLNLLLQAERTAAQNLSMSPTSRKQRFGQMTGEPTRPVYSLLSEDNRATIICFLRRISNLLHKNQIQIEEKNRIFAQQNQKNSSSNSENSFLRKLFSSNSQRNEKQIDASKIILSNEIVELLNSTRRNFMNLFQISQTTIDPDPDEDESFDSSFQLNKSMSTSVTGSRLNASYSPYEMENPITSPPNSFELKPLIWLNDQISENLNLRYGDKIDVLYRRSDLLGVFCRQLFFGPQDQLFHSIRTPQINFRYFTDIRTLFLLTIIFLTFGWIFPGQGYLVKFLFLLFVIFLWNVFRAFQSYQQSINSS